jgi:predicted DNA-binding transcriptional regulator YafY
MEHMPATSARLLALLSLLQSRPAWTGSELAGRLGVGVRTVRNDIERLRELGYPVDATRGAAGHYRLGAGASMPPLLLDDEEAVAVAVGLRLASGLDGIEELSARTVAKIDQVLPSRLRAKVTALTTTVTRAPENTGTNVADPEVDPDALAAVATAIRAQEWLRFDYRDEPRVIEPYRLVSWHRRWYVVGRDPQSGSWAPYRLDWMSLRSPTRRRFEPRPLAGEDYASFVLREVAASGYTVHARFVVLAPATEVLSRINATVGIVEPLDDESCVLVTGADSYETMAVYIGMLGLEFRVTEPPELVEHLAELSRRYARAVGAA